MSDYGKKWETSFKKNWERCFPNSFILRLNDQVSGYKVVSKNIADFIAFVEDKLFVIDCKTHLGNTISWSALSQIDLMSSYTFCNNKNLKLGFMIWWRDYDKITWVDIKEIIKMKQDGKKSINIKMLEDKTYKLVEIPSIKLKTFLKADYTVLFNEDNLND